MSSNLWAWEITVTGLIRNTKNRSFGQQAAPNIASGPHKGATP